MKLPISLALTPVVIAGLDQLASREDLSRSTAANRLLSEALAARDALPEPAAAAQMLIERISA